MIRAISIVFVGLSACATVEAEQVQYELNAVEITGTSVVLRYSNTSDVSHCINSADFNGHAPRIMFRVIEEGEQQGKPFVGLQADRQDLNGRFYESFFFVQPGDFIESEFELGDNYELSEGREYTLSFSLPVTECSAIAGGLEAVEIPTSYDPFTTLQPLESSEWARRLDVVREGRTAWANVGFFAELTTVTIAIE